MMNANSSLLLWEFLLLKQATFSFNNKLVLIPFYLKAPCEAEAQCAALVKADKVYATATEDMDSLTFGSKVLLRYMTYSEAKKMPIKEFYLERVLEAMEYTMDEVKFI